MQVNRLPSLHAYEAANHFGCTALRMQGFEASESSSFWVGLSYFLPGGGTTHDASSLEKVYVVLDGEITVKTDEEEAVLGALDSCHIPSGEARTITNRANTVATMLVVMPYPVKTS